MLKEIYLKLKEYATQRVIECSDIIHVFVKSYDDIEHEIFVSSLTNLQQILIDIGTKLENEFGFKNSAEIAMLENCCELIYMCISQECYSSEYTKDKLSELSNIFDKFIEDVLDEKRITDYHTSIVLIAKDEERYIREWLEYHLEVGISHFYIYDNESTAEFKKVLDPYIQKGIVTYTWFPGNYVQMKAYDDALSRFKLDTKYMAFIDGDEFIVPMKEDSVAKEIDYIINRYSNREYRVDWNAGGIGINWRCFGSSGHENIPDGLVIENYTNRAEDEWDNNAHIKTICNPRVAISFETNPHACSYKKGYFCISERGSYIPGAFFYDAPCNRIRINHYYTKSRQEYISKWHRGWPDTDYPFDNDDELIGKFNKLDEACSKIEDRSMEKYVVRVKERIKNPTA